MKPELINSINTVADNINKLDKTLQVSFHIHWWNTQWFSAVIGALSGFIGTFIFSTIKNRNKRLSDYYQWFLEQGTFSAPDGLLMKAIMTQYQGEDKPLGEKMIIELRSNTKYWYEPFGMLRVLFKKYEISLLKIKSGRKEEVKQQPEYIEAEKRFQRIIDFVHRKTGENEWTS